MNLALQVWLATSAISCGLSAATRGQDAPWGASRLLHLRGEAAGDLQNGTERGDLQVGTEPGKANVVSGFNVVDDWGSGNDLGSSAAPTDKSINFYLRATGGSLQLTRATVSPARLPHLLTYLDGQLALQLREQGQVNLKADEERRLTIAYACRSQGEATLSLTLEFEGLSSVQIPFKKVCGGDKNTALTVTVGSAREGEKVVIMGTPKWDELKVLGVRNKNTVFTIFVDPLSEKGSQVISTPIVTGIGSCSARIAPASAGRFDAGKKNLAAGESVDIEVEHRCFRNGNCIVSAQVPFFPDMAPYQPLRWSWTKVCGGEALGIDVEAPNRRKLATDGAENKSFAAPWIVETDVNEHTVRLINDKTRSLKSEVKVRALTVRCLDTQRCASRILEKMPGVLSSDSPLDLHVEYDCYQSGTSMVQLVLATDGHAPVITTWTKDCAAFSDSLPGVMLWMLMLCICCALACVGFMRMFDDGDEGGKAQRGKLIEEGEFLEDENLTQEELDALHNYEHFYGLQNGAASIEQVKDTSYGVQGWAAKTS